MNDTNDEWEAGLWSGGRRAEVERTGKAAVAALTAHIELVLNSDRRTGEGRLEESSQQLHHALFVLSDAEFDLTGTVSCLAFLGDADEDDVEDEDEDDLIDESAEVQQISIMSRCDLRVTSQNAVIEAGRQAYREVWPDDPPEAAGEDVDGLGRAVYQIMHARGSDAIYEADGLQMVAEVKLVLARDELMTEADLDDDDDERGFANVFDADAEIIYALTSVWK